MHLDRDKGCHGDAAWRKVASSGSVLWLGTEISYLQHKFFEKGIVLCLFVLCCDFWERYPIHDIGSPGFVCVKQSLRNRMCGWVAIVETAVLPLLILPPLHSVTSDAICTCLRMCEGGAEGCPAIWYALQTLPKQRAKHLEQLFHRCSSLWFVFMLKKTFTICLNPLYRHSPEVFIYYHSLKNKNYILYECSFRHFWQPPSPLPPGMPPKKMVKFRT